MSSQIRWGIMSTARIGEKRVIPAIQKSRNGFVAAVASRSHDRAQAFANAFSIPKAYGAYEALLEDPDIDAIYIPLPNSEHALWSIRCAEAGKPVLCEKPVAVDADQAQQIIDAFNDRNLHFAEAFMYRYHPQHQKVKDLIQDGTIGEVHLIEASFTFSLREDNNIRLKKSLAGGALMDVGCYCVNIMRYLTQAEPLSAQALAYFGEASEVDETITGMLRFPPNAISSSGTLGHFDASLRMHRTHYYELRGTHGRIIVPEAFVPELDPSVQLTIQLWKGSDYQELHVGSTDQYQLMVEDFADTVLNRTSARFAPQDAVLNMRALDMLINAAHNND